jgi:hypothetical protein
MTEGTQDGQASHGAETQSRKPQVLALWSRCRWTSCSALMPSSFPLQGAFSLDCLLSPSGAVSVPMKRSIIDLAVPFIMMTLLAAFWLCWCTAEP